MKFAKILHATSIVIVAVLWMTAWTPSSVAQNGNEGNAQPTENSSIPLPSATAKVPISREALRQCEIDARKAERTDEALDAAEKAKRRAARCGGALDAKDQDLARARAEKEQMVRRSQTLRIVTYIASGVAVVSTGLVVGDVLEVWDL